MYLPSPEAEVLGAEELHSGDLRQSRRLLDVDEHHLEDSSVLALEALRQREGLGQIVLGQNGAIRLGRGRCHAGRLREPLRE
jgi:hypothetical protein